MGQELGVGRNMKETSGETSDREKSGGCRSQSGYLVVREGSPEQPSRTRIISQGREREP